MVLQRRHALASDSTLVVIRAREVQPNEVEMERQQGDQKAGEAAREHERKAIDVRRRIQAVTSAAVRINHLDQLVVHCLGVLLAGANRARRAVFQVVAHQLARHAAKRLVHR